MATPLLRSRRLLPILTTQTLGALNDNLFKNALVVLVIFQLRQGGPALVAAAGGVLMLPFALFSSLAGQVADRFEKSRVIRLAKWLELALMGIAAIGFSLPSTPLLMLVLFGLGTQAAFFSPLKYGVLPACLAATELVRGNALMEAGTFAGILAGTIGGGLLVGLAGGPTIVAVAGLLIAAAGIVAAAFVPPAPAGDAALKIGWNILRETGCLVAAARANRPVWLAILGLSWFWALGATFIAEFPVLARDDFGADNRMVTLMLACFAVGVGAGSILAGRLLRGDVSPRNVPAAALALSVSGGAFAWLVRGVTPATGWHGVTALAHHPSGLLAMACLFATAAAGGAFSVPLYAMIQHHSDPAHRARMIAANNVLNAAAMVAGAVTIAGLSALHLRAPSILALACLLNLAVALRIILLIPDQALRSLMRAYFSLLHGVTVTGLENYRAAGPSALILPNHQSFMDGPLIAAFLPDEPSFVVDTHIAGKWWARPFLAPLRIITADPANPFAVRDMVHAVQGGAKLMMFPEGRITRTGGLMKIYDGAGMIADRAGCPVVPVRIDGPLFTPFSQMGGKLRRRWFPPLSIHFMRAARLSVDPHLQGRARRRALGERVQDLMIAAELGTRNLDRTLFAALLDAAHRHGGSVPIIEDMGYAPLTYRKLILAAVVLGGRLAGLAGPGRALGVMLPSANGAMVTFMALQAFGRVPAMLNFTAGAEAMLAACRAAKVGTVLSSRQFIEKARLGAVIERMAQQVVFVWLEDVRATITTAEKLRGMVRAHRPHNLPGARSGAGTPAVILFTSGSEGAPKGVALSHRNILANCAQIGAVVDFNPSDRVLNALPMFHSFGLTGATLLPLFAGVATFYYPSPLHYRVVPELAYGTNATIAFGTDTFLTGWARFAHPYDFRAMRYIFAGGEKLRPETRRLYADRFGVRLLEGYGVTETGPVLALNTPMHSRPGSVGRLLPGIDFRLEPVAGVQEGGRLLVRGPNVMLGYLRADAPGDLQAPPEGWHDTGDIVTCGADRFVTIVGRAKRFAKIGGEMVSMAAAEGLVRSLWPEAMHAVVSVADARKGEALVLVTTQADAGAAALLQHARANGVPEIMVPRTIKIIGSMPLLGTGKIDIPAVQRQVLDAAQPATSALHSAPADSPAPLEAPVG
jgi:acyl-[acyl-carrier-protein]-phospholipid O-acyltransferase/long-chain-fatty-acid--[acyl-carrier-protein] ligase